MATPILFIHSAGVQEPGKGSLELIDYLRIQLGSSYRLICPPMPQPDNPRYDTWTRHLEKQLDMIDEEMILIGHSLGGSVLLKYLSEVPSQKRITAVFTIASPLFGAKRKELEEFVPKPDFGKHLISIPDIYFYHSHDDTVVPFTHVLEYHRALPQAHLRAMDGYGHLFDRPCPLLITDIHTIPINNSVSIRAPKKMINNKIAKTVEQATEDFIHILSEIDENQINTVPFEGSWTVGQVADHLIKSEKNLPEVLIGQTTLTDRKADEKIPILESIFLDFSTKLKAPDFIIPSNEPLDKNQLIETLGEIRHKLSQIAANEDLTATCMERSFPGLGKLTRWEWLNFVVFHSTRHSRQLRNIQAQLAPTRESRSHIE